MSSWSIDFAPMLPAPAVLGRGACWRCVLVGAAAVPAQRAARCCARCRWRRCCWRSPTRRCAQEERESLANIAIVVVDESPSQTHRRPARADRGHPARSGSQARRHPQPAGALGHVVASRPAKTASGTQPLRRPQQRARQHAARPAGRRHHDHRRPGARRAEVGRSAGLRRARARAAHRPARRVRPPHRGAQGAALRHRRPDARHRGRAWSRPARKRPRRRAA